MRPRIFASSSSEACDVAYALQEQLEDEADVTVWTQRVFEPSHYTLESLLSAVGASDVGVFVFSPDDSLRVRGEDVLCPGDNVLLEFGLFLGRHGLNRCFMLVPSGLRVATDLEGLTTLRYRCDRDDNNLVAALGPACNKIRRAIRGLPRDGLGGSPDRPWIGASAVSGDHSPAG
jgi:predicted nucleotide-binding protein